MKLTTKYVGFDVHQATTVASVRNDSGRMLARSVLETHGPSIVEFLRGMRGALHVAFEAPTRLSTSRRFGRNVSASSIRPRETSVRNQTLAAGRDIPCGESSLTRSR